MGSKPSCPTDNIFYIHVHTWVAYFSAKKPTMHIPSMYM